MSEETSRTAKRWGLWNYKRLISTHYTRIEAEQAGALLIGGDIDDFNRRISDGSMSVTRIEITEMARKK